MSAKSLSPRQREILHLVARGQSNKEISNNLGIKENTVSEHISRILCRLRARTRAHAVMNFYCR